MLPRVTEILRPLTTYDQVPEYVLHRAAARGTTVHALCAAIAKGEWVPDGMIDAEHLPYVNSFRSWAEQQVEKFVIIEQRYSDENAGFTGQLDFVIKGKDNELYLVDIKTSARPQKTYPLQMAAYDLLLRNHGIEVKAAMLVYLSKDNEFPNIDCIEDLKPEREVFMAALTCYNYIHRRKNNGNNSN